MNNHNAIIRLQRSPSVQAGACHGQRGQAMAEGVAVLCLFLVFFVATGWLGRLQDIAMTAQHASSLAAFTFARSDLMRQEASSFSRADRLFLGNNGQRWLDLRGHSLVHGTHVPQLLPRRHDQLPAQAYPGGAGVHARALRQDWGMGDRSVVTTTVRMPWKGPGGVISPVFSSSVDNETSTKPNDVSIFGFPVANNAFLHRHTVLLAGAGHASHDAEAGMRIGRSWFGWQRSARTSVRLAESVGRVMEPVDAAWRRPSVSTDWIARWAGRVPRAHLSPRASGLTAH
ncbi:hypothetical protein D7I39_19770 [Allopusillimonas ginsengisoli]|nr:hypothetical protein D7I39_19770 [Allopusillimonas ginsengisoli]